VREDPQEDKKGRWFDSLYVYWKDLKFPGRFMNSHYPEPQGGIRDHSLLAAHIRVKPGESGRAEFIISWNFPNCYYYWNPEKNEGRRPGT